MVKFKRVGIIAGIAMAAFLVGCSKPTPPVDEAAPKVEAPAAPKAAPKAASSSSPAQAKKVNPLAAEHPYNAKSRMVLTIGAKEISPFSLTPSNPTDKGVVVTAGVVVASDTPLAKDSLVIAIDDEPVKFSPDEKDPYVYLVDTATITKMMTAKKVVIDLYVEENKYFEGDFNATSKDTFRDRLSEVLKGAAK